MQIFRKIFFLTLAFSFLLIQPVFAYKTIDSSNNQLDRVIAPTGIEKTDIKTTTGNLIRNTLTIVGTLFLALMIYGGFLWMTARGEEDQINKGKNTIVAAIIGLAVIVSAYAVTNVITTNLIKSNAGSIPPRGAGTSLEFTPQEVCVAQNGIWVLDECQLPATPQEECEAQAGTWWPVTQTCDLP